MLDIVCALRRSRPHDERWVGLATALLLSLQTACADPGHGDIPTGVTVTDSADLQLVEVGAEVLDGLPKWSLSEEPILTIGERLGDDPYMFGRIRGALRLPTGEIVIVEEFDFEIRVFGPDGVFRRAFGREGEGPGEFMRVSLWKLMDGFAVEDDRLRRLTLFNGQAAMEATRPSACGPGDSRLQHDPPLCYFAGLTGDGVVFSYGARPSGEPPPRLRPDVVLRYPGSTRILAFDPGDGALVIDSVSARSRAAIWMIDPGTRAEWSVPELFAPEGHWAFGPRTVALGESVRFEVRLHDTAGVLRRILRVAGEPELVTAAHIDAIKDLMGTPASLSPRELAMQYLNEVPVAGSIPFFSELRFDDAGRLWVAEYVPPRVLVTREEWQWTIFDENVLPLARISTVPSGDILDIGEDYILLRERDDMDVERVAMYGIERS